MTACVCVNMRQTFMQHGTGSMQVTTLTWQSRYHRHTCWEEGHPLPKGTDHHRHLNSSKVT